MHRCRYGYGACLKGLELIESDTFSCWEVYAAQAMSQQGAEAGPLERPCGRMLPLKSKRLTAPNLQRLARALKVPESASRADTLQMVEGKLVPRNVQVVLVESAMGICITLQDQDVIFFKIQSEETVATVEMVAGGGTAEPTAEEEQQGRKRWYRPKSEKSETRN